MIRFLAALTDGHPHLLSKPIILNMTAGFFRAMPHGLVLLALYEMFRPLQEPHLPLRMQAIGWITGMIVIALGLQYYFVFKGNVAASLASFDLGRKGRLQFGEHLRKLSLGFFNNRDRGDLTNLLLQDFARKEQLIYQTLPNTAGAAVVPPMIAVVLALYDWRLALALAAVLPAAALVMLVALRMLGRFSRTISAGANESAGLILEYLEGLKSIRIHNRAEIQYNQLKASLIRNKQEHIRAELMAVPLLLLSNVIVQSGFVIILLTGVYFFLGGSLTLTVLVLFLVMSARFYEPFFQLLMDISLIRLFQVSLKRIEAVRQEPAMQGDMPFPEGAPHIRFERVSFAYYNQQAPILHNISFEMKPGSLTALVGASGSGKTTITRLLARFWDVNSGSITVNGLDIRKIDPEQLISRISMVFQDVYLFHDTILNNLRIGNSQASREQIIEASKLAQCHRFISTLPEGYDTIVGEGGSTLSGGEKQRISIARAILKDAPIVLLDEATASLDPLNESIIQRGLRNLIIGKTVLVIAHRLHTVIHADQILVLEEGHILERGSHQELLEAKGRYADLWHKQYEAKVWRIAPGPQQEAGKHYR